MFGSSAIDLLSLSCQRPNGFQRNLEQVRLHAGVNDGSSRTPFDFPHSQCVVRRAITSCLATARVLIALPSVLASGGEPPV